MRSVVYPLAARRDPLAGGNHGGVADDGHEIAVAACLRAQHAETVVGIVVGDALHEARKNFVGRWLRLRPHVALRRALTESSRAVRQDGLRVASNDRTSA